MKRNSRLSINFKIFIRNIIILFVALFILSSLLITSFGHNDIKTQVYTVEENDTLWKIANGINHNLNNKKNIYYIIDNIKEINNIKTNDIYIGQVIMLPIYN